ncbi:hypothetical protein ELI25_29500 (plasmid) [Rhizobium ruizarguesonis]|uniref:hypothetical protein n=1 Tax=Rhizobium ruizarguesonis TaxID=2081791 RepID=UPI001030DE5F|nr:hypothetical protein [Rhizobium ruizarguesonis]TAW06607.1 hypothetical protein ELI25_29500 [Rhizobium ruizarguesonis]
MKLHLVNAIVTICLTSTSAQAQFQVVENLQLRHAVEFTMATGSTYGGDFQGIGAQLKTDKLDRNPALKDFAPYAERTVAEGKVGFRLVLSNVGKSDCIFLFNAPRWIAEISSVSLPDRKFDDPEHDCGAANTVEINHYR